MRPRAALLIILLVLPTTVVMGSQDKPPNVAIISNEADMPTARFIGELLSNTSVHYEIIGPESFGEALRNYDVILILGGPEAYDGVGNISSNYIPPRNATTLINEPRSFLISIFKGGRDIIVLAGHTRKETLEATALFFKDQSQLSLTKLFGWAGYPVDSNFRKGLEAVYAILKPTKYGEEVAVGSVKIEVTEDIVVNGTTLHNVTTTSFRISLGVKYMNITSLLVDDYNRPRICKRRIYVDDNLTGVIEGCPRPPSSGSLAGSYVFVTIKMESYGNRTTWRFFPNQPVPTRRTGYFEVGNTRVKASLVLRYIFNYPKWEVIPEFVIFYVNPSLPFGGTVVRSDNRVENGQVITTEVTKLVSFSFP